MTPEQIRIYREMTPAQKLELAARFNSSARRLKALGLRLQHPEWPEERVMKRVKELFVHAAS